MQTRVMTREGGNELCFLKFLVLWLAHRLPGVVCAVCNVSSYRVLWSRSLHSGEVTGTGTLLNISESQKLFFQIRLKKNIYVYIYFCLYSEHLLFSYHLANISLSQSLFLSCSVVTLGSMLRGPYGMPGVEPNS